MDRSRDWWVQAQADLRHARHSLDDGAYEWACFAAHQSAEKALMKAVFEKKRQRAWGHTLTLLLQALQDEVEVSADLVERTKVLDKHYIPTRYPNGLEQGAPAEFYTHREAEDAIRDSEAILWFCDGLLRG